MSLTSPLKSLVHPSTGRALHMGRTRPPPVAERSVHLMAGNYFKAVLPRRPARTFHASHAEKVLSQILLNDQLGDCTVAGMYHIAGTVLGCAGTPISVTQEQVKSVYARSGWRASDPSTDQGWNEPTALNSWMTEGLPITVNGVTSNHRCAGWLTADPGDVEQMKNLLWLFENLYFGWELPDAWVKADMPSKSGFTWDVAGDPDPDNGHCTIAMDYDDAKPGPAFDTWGLQGIVTWEAIAKYSADQNGGEVHCIITPDSLARATKKAPSGFDWSALVGDFQAMGGHLGDASSLLG